MRDPTTKAGCAGAQIALRLGHEVEGTRRRELPLGRAPCCAHAARRHSAGYDGGLRPAIPPALGETRLPNTENLLVFEKAVVMMGGDYGSDMSVYPTKEGAEIETPPQTLPSSPSHYEEFVQACRGEGKTLSDFAYAGPMCEMILLGNVAVRLGQKLARDGRAMKVTNVDEANEHLWREPREGLRV